MKKDKFTLKQFNNFFPIDDSCLEYIFKAQTKDKETYNNCNSKFSYYKITDRKCYACANCGYQTHPLANTIFHKSYTLLIDWFYCIYLFSVSKNGVSGKEIERDIGCTYKIAWRIANRIRSLLTDDNSNLLGNIVKIDET